MGGLDTRAIGEADNVVMLRNINVCHEGVLLRGQNVHFSSSSGLILSSSVDEIKTPGASNAPVSQTTPLELDVDTIVAPGLIELQTNGLCGIHFTTLTEENHEKSLEKVSLEMAKNGVTAWYATIPTVEETRWKEVSTY